MVAQVPTQDVETIYGRIGDAFAYLCVLGLLGLTGLAMTHRRHAAVSGLQPA